MSEWLHNGGPFPWAEIARMAATVFAWSLVLWGVVFMLLYALSYQVCSLQGGCS